MHLDLHALLDLVHGVDIPVHQADGRRIELPDRQMEAERLDRLLVVVVPDGQLEIMVRRFGIDRCDHRHETRQIEFERRGIFDLVADRESERLQSGSHLLRGGVGQVHLRRKAQRAELLRREGWRVNVDQEARDAARSRYLHLDRHSGHDLLHGIDIPVHQLDYRRVGRAAVDLVVVAVAAGKDRRRRSETKK